MSYKIVVDSCCELPEELYQDSRIESIPLELEVGSDRILDDETFNQAEFLRKVAECPECPKSSCPSPERYREAYHVEAERIYVVTLSSHLSGSHNSAMLGKNLYLEKYGEKQIHIVDSESACCGEGQIVIKLMELEEQGLSFEEIVNQIEAFRDNMKTYFVLDNLDALRKNGRLTGIKSLAASALNIKPVMSADKGVIIQKGQCIGTKKALIKMVEMVLEELAGRTERTLMISHCNAPERAKQVQKMIMERAEFKKSLIVDTRGVGSLYASDGGIVVTI